VRRASTFQEGGVEEEVRGCKVVGDSKQLLAVACVLVASKRGLLCVVIWC
jgi:hypothetical protein